MRKDDVMKSDDSKVDNTTKKQGNRNRTRKGGKKSNYAKSGYKKTPASNALEWHVNDAELLRLSSSLSWSYSTGDLFDISDGIKDPNGLISHPSSTYTLPGIMSFAEIPWVGGMDDEGTYPPATYAANTLLTEERSRTRVRNTYDAPDIIQKILAMASVYAGIAWAKRLYATLKMYTYESEYLPDALYAAQHFDPSSLRCDPYAFLGRLNVIISNANKIYIPKNMPLFEYYTQRYSNYFIEGKSIKDQIYVIYPAILTYLQTFTANKKAYVELDPCLAVPNDGAATYTANKANGVKSGTKSITGEQLLDALDFMIAQLVNDSDTPDITGDLQNAFGDENRYVIPQITPDVMAVPVFDEEILEMLQNSYVSYRSFDVFKGYSWGADSHHMFMIYQEPDTNKVGNYNSVLATDIHRALADATPGLLNVHQDPDPSKTCLITRNRTTTTGYAGSATSVNLRLHAAGSMLVKYEVFWFEEDTETQLPTLRSHQFCSTVAKTAEYPTFPFAKVDVFHYHPTLTIYTDDTGAVEDYFGALDIIAQIPTSQVLEINRIDMLTALGAYNKF
jgi:hypothetical protein